jgi:hypothetical protein
LRCAGRSRACTRRDRACAARALRARRHGLAGQGEACAVAVSLLPRSCAAARLRGRRCVAVVVCVGGRAGRRVGGWVGAHIRVWVCRWARQQLRMGALGWRAGQGVCGTASRLHRVGISGGAVCVTVSVQVTPGARGNGPRQARSALVAALLHDAQHTRANNSSASTPSTPTPDLLELSPAHSQLEAHLSMQRAARRQLQASTEHAVRMTVPAHIVHKCCPRGSRTKHTGVQAHARHAAGWRTSSRCHRRMRCRRTSRVATRARGGGARGVPQGWPSSHPDYWVSLTQAAHPVAPAGAVKQVRVRQWRCVLCCVQTHRPLCTTRTTFPSLTHHHTNTHAHVHAHTYTHTPNYTSLSGRPHFADISAMAGYARPCGR